MGVFRAAVLFLRAWFVTRATLAADNLAMRQQLAVFKQSRSRPRLRRWDRIFWTWLMRLWPGWRSALLIVQPETVVRWHRQGFRLYWCWKSRNQQPGRPKIDAEVRALIRRLSQENPTWGAPRIQSEIAMTSTETLSGKESRVWASMRFRLSLVHLGRIRIAKG